MSDRSNKKVQVAKLGTVACLLMTLGSIIGAGFFNIVPIAISAYVGNGIVIAFIVTAVVTVVRTLPSMYLGSALPITGGTYAYATRMFHPFLGFIQAIAFVTGTLNIATMGMTAANYLLPAMGVQVVDGGGGQVFAAIALILLFAFISTFGVKASGQIQNVIVIVNVIALSVFFVVGLININPANISLGSMFTFHGETSAMQWSNMIAAVALLSNVLNGGTIVMSIAEEVEKPGLNVPISFFGGMAVSTFFYALCSFVAVGVYAPGEAFPGTLTAVAQRMWDNPLFYRGFSLLGGALAAITTLNGVILLYSRLHFAVARDGFWPKVIARTNKFHVPYVALWCCTGLSAAFLLVQYLTGQTSIISVLVSTTTLPSLLLGFIVYLPCAIFPYKYKNAAKTAVFRMPQWLNIAVCIIATILGLYLSWGILTRTQNAQYWINFGIFWLVFVAYYFVRVWYLKKYKGVDLVADLKKPAPQWEVREKSAAEELAQKAE